MIDIELLPTSDEIATFSKTPLGVNAEVDKQRLLRMQEVMQGLEALPPEEQATQLAEALAGWQKAALSEPVARSAHDGDRVQERALALLSDLGPLVAPHEAAAEEMAAPHEAVAAHESKQVTASEPVTTEAAAGMMSRPAIADVPAPPEPPPSPKTNRDSDPPPAKPEVMPPSATPDMQPPSARPDVAPPSRVPKSGALGFMMLGDAPLCNFAASGESSTSAQQESTLRDPAPILPPPDSTPPVSVSGPVRLSRMLEHVPVLDDEMPVAEEETVFDPELANPRDTLPGAEGLAVAAKLAELPFQQIDDEATVTAEPKSQSALPEDYALPFRSPARPSPGTPATDTPATDASATDASAAEMPTTRLSETLEEGIAPAPSAEPAAEEQRQLLAAAEHYAALCALRDEYEHWLEAAFTRLGATTAAARAQCDAAWRKRLMDDQKLLVRFQQAYEHERRRLGGAPET